MVIIEKYIGDLQRETRFTNFILKVKHFNDKIGELSIPPGENKTHRGSWINKIKEFNRTHYFGIFNDYLIYLSCIIKIEDFGKFINELNNINTVNDLSMMILLNYSYDPFYEDYCCVSKLQQLMDDYKKSNKIDTLSIYKFNIIGKLSNEKRDDFKKYKDDFIESICHEPSIFNSVTLECYRDIVSGIDSVVDDINNTVSLYYTEIKNTEFSLDDIIACIGSTMLLDNVDNSECIFYLETKFLDGVSDTERCYIKKIINNNLCILIYNLFMIHFNYNKKIGYVTTLK